MPQDNSARKAFLIGAGIGSLASAALLIRDGAIPGRDITLFESLPVTGGSLDGGGSAQRGYTLRGGRMLTTDNYECTWDLFKSIPSLEHPGQTVLDETVAFNERNPSHSMARIVDRNRARIDVTSMGFTLEDRLELLKLAEADDAALGASPLTDWLSPRFFETNFWFMWATTFAFQPWHSALEFRRYLHRFMKEFSRIETLAGVKRTVYNQYDSLVRPLVAWLQGQGVRFEADTTVKDMDSDSRDGRHTVTALHVECDGTTRVVPVEAGDLVFFTNASMTDASSFGSMSSAPPRHTKKDSGGWSLWERIAADRAEQGGGANAPAASWSTTCRSRRAAPCPVGRTGVALALPAHRARPAFRGGACQGRPGALRRTGPLQRLRRPWSSRRSRARMPRRSRHRSAWRDSRRIRRRASPVRRPSSRRP